MQKRLNKEYKLNVNNSIKLIYGSVDRLNPEVIYTNGRTWVSPQTKGNYEANINLILKTIRKHIRNKLLHSVSFSKNHICDFDISSASLNEGNNTFLSFEIFLKQNLQPIQDLKQIKPLINDFCTDVVNIIEQNFSENNFAFSQTKHFS